MINMLNKIKSLAKIGVLATGVALLSGCRGTYVATKDIDAKGDYKVGVEASVGLKPERVTFNLPKKFVPVHQQDAGFLNGGTFVQAEGGYSSSLVLGVRGTIGSENIVGYGGIDLLLSEESGKKDDVGYDFRQQTSDRRPASQGSFTYDSFKRNVFAPMPVLGLRIKAYDWEVSPEIGFPFREFDREWGHHRWNREEPIGNESEDVMGTSYSVSISRKLEDFDDASIGLRYGRETYPTKKFGDITGDSLMFEFRSKF